MSYTLRGRLEARLAAALLPLVVAAAATAHLHRWWPFEVATAMLAAGLALDVLLWHRLLPYQPAWAAVPMGLAELAAVLAVLHLAMIMPPMRAALALFALAWVSAQLLGHAVLPYRRLSYAEDGGELGATGAAVALGVAALVAGGAGAAWATQPPTVRLAAGVHEGPIVIDRTETLVGEPGAVVRGGIVVTADDVTVRDVTVLGGEDGVRVENATGVVLDGVRVRGARLDGFHVRRAQVAISDCTIGGLRSRYAQGVDISFSYDMPVSRVERCRIRGGQEGIVADSSRVDVRENDVSDTTLRGITVTEMSTGNVEENRVTGALGIGIFCADQSQCGIARNTVSGTRPDLGSADLARRGYAIESHSGATAFLSDNRLAANPLRLGAFVGGDFRSGDGPALGMSM